MKKILILITFFLIINAEELEKNKNITISTFKTIETLNKGIKRDFYINKYFKEDITKDEALKALSFVDNFTNEMFYNFAKKFNHDETLAVAQCMNMKREELLSSYADCIVNGFSLEDISTLSAVDLELIKQKTEDKYPTFTKRLKVFSSSIPFTKLIILEKNEFYNIYLNVDDDFRVKYFDYKLPKRTFQKIFKDKKNFEKFLQISLTDLRLKRLQKSLIEIDDSKLDDNSSFLLALNAIRFNELSKAMIYLNNAKEKTNNKKVVDKILFWKYQITTDKRYLNELLNSNSLNLYSLYVREFSNIESIDLSFLQRINEFDSLLEKYDINRVSLLYSLAKVKSNFEVNKISENFELGIMQLNYKLISSLSSSSTLFLNNQKLDSFSIENNLKLANLHINNIEKKTTNPIFSTLIYEGNNKYLNKKLKSGLFSTKSTNSMFEPFLSLELISNKKKEYLKDILMYKYLYQNHLTKKSKEKITLSSIFENLFVPYQKLGE